MPRNRAYILEHLTPPFADDLNPLATSTLVDMHEAALGLGVDRTAYTIQCHWWPPAPAPTGPPAHMTLPPTTPASAPAAPSAAAPVVVVEGIPFRTHHPRRPRARHTARGRPRRAPADP